MLVQSPIVGRIRLIVRSTCYSTIVGDTSDCWLLFKQLRVFKMWLDNCFQTRFDKAQNNLWRWVARLPSHPKYILLSPIGWHLVAWPCCFIAHTNPSLMPCPMVPGIVVMIIPVKTNHCTGETAKLLGWKHRSMDVNGRLQHSIVMQNVRKLNQTTNLPFLHASDSAYNFHWHHCCTKSRLSGCR